MNIYLHFYSKPLDKASVLCSALYKGTVPHDAKSFFFLNADFSPYSSYFNKILHIDISIGYIDIYDTSFSSQPINHFQSIMNYDYYDDDY